MNVTRGQIARNGGNWFACFSVESPDAEPVAIRDPLGIDAGLDSFMPFPEATRRPKRRVASGKGNSGRGCCNALLPANVREVTVGEKP